MNTTPKRGDRVRNVHGFAGTVEAVYPDEGLARIKYDDEVRGRIVGRVWHSKVAELELIPPTFRSIAITADEVGVGHVLNYPVWRHPRPEWALGNVNPEPLRVTGVDDTYPENRVLWFEAPGTSAVVARTARLELVVPVDDDYLVDQLAELEAAIAEGEAGPELKRTAERLAKVRGRIIDRAGRAPAAPPAATVGGDPWLGQ